MAGGGGADLERVGGGGGKNFATYSHGGIILAYSERERFF